MEVPEADMVNHGRDEIVTNVSTALVGARTRHHGHMPEIEITGDDTARGIWAMFDYVEWPKHDGTTLGTAGLRPLPRGVRPRRRRLAHRPYSPRAPAHRRDRLSASDRTRSSPEEELVRVPVQIGVEQFG